MDTQITRMLAFDLYGTLLKSNGSLSLRAETAIHEAHNQGFIIVLATGRPWAMTKPVADLLGCVDYGVCLNGAVVVDASNEKIIDVSSMSKEQAVDAAVIARNLLGKVALAADMADGSHIWEHSFVFDSPPGLVIEAKKVDDAVSAIDGPVLTWLVDTPNHPGLSAIDILQGRLPEGTEVRPSGLGTPEIVLVGVSKASGLALISNTRSIDSSEVMAFGDGLNDLEMLKWAGRSIAMGNGHQLARDLATEIAPSNDADGVAEVLEALLAQKKLGS